METVYKVFYHTAIWIVLILFGVACFKHVFIYKPVTVMVQQPQKG